MEQMRGCVVAANVGAARPIDFEVHEITLFYLAGDELARMDD